MKKEFRLGNCPAGGEGKTVGEIQIAEQEKNTERFGNGMPNRLLKRLWAKMGGGREVVLLGFSFRTRIVKACGLSDLIFQVVSDTSARKSSLCRGCGCGGVWRVRLRMELVTARSSSSSFWAGPRDNQGSRVRKRGVRSRRDRIRIQFLLMSRGVWPLLAGCAEPIR